MPWRRWTSGDRGWNVQSLHLGTTNAAGICENERGFRRSGDLNFTIASWILTMETLVLFGGKRHVAPLGR